MKTSGNIGSIASPDFLYRVRKGFDYEYLTEDDLSERAEAMSSVEKVFHLPEKQRVMYLLDKRDKFSYIAMPAHIFSEAFSKLTDLFPGKVVKVEIMGRFYEYECVLETPVRVIWSKASKSPSLTIKSMGLF